jgi:uncharacterized protein YndB with AHSA1/START domain
MKGMTMIHHKTYIKVPKEEVYKTITSADGWNAWFTDKTSLHTNSNGTGEIRFRWTDFGSENATIEDGGTIIESVQNEKFVFQWSPGNATTTVTFNLLPYKEGTLVTLEEIGYSNTAEDISACIGCATGWGEALTLLKIYLELGIVYKQDL